MTMSTSTIRIAMTMPTMAPALSELLLPLVDESSGRRRRPRLHRAHRTGSPSGYGARRRVRDAMRTSRVGAVSNRQITYWPPEAPARPSTRSPAASRSRRRAWRPAQRHNAVAADRVNLTRQTELLPASRSPAAAPPCTTCSRCRPRRHAVGRVRTDAADGRREPAVAHARRLLRVRLSPASRTRGTYCGLGRKRVPRASA